MHKHCRMCVNNDKDLAVCRREINIISNLTGHKNLICYVDRFSSFTGHLKKIDINAKILGCIIFTTSLYHPWSFLYSQINQTEAKVHEVLLLMPYHKVLSNQYCSTVPAQFRPLNKNMSTYSFALGAHAPTHERTVVYRFHRRWGWI